MSVFFGVEKWPASRCFSQEDDKTAPSMSRFRPWSNSGDSSPWKRSWKPPFAAWVFDGSGETPRKKPGKTKGNPKFWAHLRNYTSIDPKQHKSSLRHPHRFLWFLFMGLHSVISIECWLYFLRRPAPPPPSMFPITCQLSVMCIKVWSIATGGPGWQADFLVILPSRLHDSGQTLLHPPPMRARAAQPTLHRIARSGCFQRGGIGVWNQRPYTKIATICMA